MAERRGRTVEKTVRGKSTARSRSGKSTARGGSRQSPADNKPAAEPKFPMGTRVSKFFYDEDAGEERPFTGVVVGYIPHEQSYSIEYEDGDKEDVSEEELATIVANSVVPDPVESTVTESTLPTSSSKEATTKDPNRSSTNMSPELSTPSAPDFPPNERASKHPAKDKRKREAAKAMKNKRRQSVSSAESLSNRKKDDNGNQREVTVKGCKMKLVTTSSTKKRQKNASKPASNCIEEPSVAQSTLSPISCKEVNVNSPNFNNAEVSSQLAAPNELDFQANGDNTTDGTDNPSSNWIGNMVAQAFDKQKEFYEQRLRAEKASREDLQKELKEQLGQIERLKEQLNTEREEQRSHIDRLQDKLKGEREAKDAIVCKMKEEKEQLTAQLNTEKELKKYTSARLGNILRLIKEWRERTD